MTTKDISGIDFPVLMLANPAQIPFLSGCGSDGNGLIGDVEVAYEPDDTDDEDSHQDEPALRLRTMARRRRRLINGQALTSVGSLQSLGELAATSILLSAIPNSSGIDSRQAIDRAMVEGRDLGFRIPGPPWVLQSLELDGMAYALWVLAMSDNRFCLVADCGPIVLTGTGRHIDAWTFALSAVPAARAQERLRIIDADSSDG